MVSQVGRQMLGWSLVCGSLGRRQLYRRKRNQDWAECRHMVVSDDSMGALELEWPFSVSQSWAEMNHDWIWATPGTGMTLDQVASVAETVLGGADGELFVVLVAETSPSLKGAWWAIFMYTVDTDGTPSMCQHHACKKQISVILYHSPLCIEDFLLSLFFLSSLALSFLSCLLRYFSTQHLAGRMQSY